MKRRIKITLFSIVLLMLTLATTKVYAKSYKINDMDIEATVKQNGDVDVKQEITYDFKGSYNGIYIDIPNNVKDEEYDKYRVQGELKDSLYNASKVTVNKVLIENKEIKKANYAYNGNKDLYTEISDAGIKRIKIYSPSTNVKKTFTIQYTLSNLCVKHNDVGELYYNFIGGEWQTEIQNLNIDIYLPNNMNKSELKVFGHGPYNGECKIVNENTLNFKVQNIKEGQYVATRVVFPISNIKDSTKSSNLNAQALIMQDENNIIENKEAKQRFTKKVMIFAGVLFIYWIALILIFEKDKKYTITNIKEEELFEKYNPLLAGCVQESRTILARDIIAVIVNLINKNIVKLELIPVLERKENYCYKLVKVQESEAKLDEIEKFVYTWVFENKDSIDLVNRLKELPKEKNANKEFKRLNDLAQRKLNEMGANREMPLTLKAFNTILFAISIIVIYIHIQYNGLNIYSFEKIGGGLGSIFMYAMYFLPLTMMLLYIPIRILIMLRHGVNRLTKKITGKRIVNTILTITLISAIVIIITSIMAPNTYLIVDEILFTISLIIILTDNLMLKNSPIMIEDFSRLNSLKEKLENTLMDSRDIEYVTLWNEYLSYAISFGIANKIIEKLKGLNLDDDLMKLVEDNNFYDYISSDYYMFYQYASLDRRFMKAYGNMIESTVKYSGGGGYSSRRRRRLLRWRRLLRRRRTRRRRRRLLKKLNNRTLKL